MSRSGRETVAERLCDVLVALLDRGGRMTVSELQDATGFERRTLYRYLAALGSCDLVRLEDGVAELGRPLRRPRARRAGA